MANGNYTLNKAELGGLTRGYGNLGGAEGTGLAFSDYLSSMGLERPQNTTLGLTTDQWGNIGAIGDIGQGLAGLFMGKKMMDAEKARFEASKDLLGREYAMAKDAYDRQVKRAGDIGSQMRAGSVSALS